MIQDETVFMLLCIALLISALAVALFCLYRIRKERKREQVFPAPVPLPHSSPINAMPTEPTKPSEQSDIHTLILGDDPDHPMVTIRRAPLEPAPNSEIIHLEESFRGRLSSIFCQLPNLAGAASNFASNRLILTFSPETARGLESGINHLMRSGEQGFRAIAQNADGKIVEIGILQPMSGLRLASIATGFWQLATFITAQKHLAIINQSLQCLDRGLGEIKAFLENETRGKIQGSINYLHQWYQLLQQQELELDRIPFLNDQLEKFEHEFLQIAEAGKGTLDYQIGKIEGEDYSGFWLKDNAEKFSSMYQGVRNAYQRQLTMLYGRLTDVHFKLALDGDPKLIPIRIKDIQQAVDEMKESIQEFEKITNKKVSTMTAWFRYKETEDQYQCQVKNLVKPDLKKFNSSILVLQNMVDSVRQSMTERDKMKDPVQIEITLTPTGEIASACRILPQGEQLIKMPDLDTVPVESNQSQKECATTESSR